MLGFLLLLAELLIDRRELLAKLDILRTLLALVVNLVSSYQIFDTCLILTPEMAIIAALMLGPVLLLLDLTTWCFNQFGIFCLHVV